MTSEKKETKKFLVPVTWVVAAEVVTVNLISLDPTSSQANAPPACVVGLILPAFVPLAKVLTIVAAPPTVSPILILVVPLAAVITSNTQSIICEFAGITTSVSSADIAPLDKSIANVCDITT